MSLRIGVLKGALMSPRENPVSIAQRESCEKLQDECSGAPAHDGVSALLRARRGPHGALGLPDSSTEGSKCLLFKPPGLRHSIVAARADFACF